MELLKNCLVAQVLETLLTKQHSMWSSIVSYPRCNLLAIFDRFFILHPILESNLRTAAIGHVRQKVPPFHQLGRFSGFLRLHQSSLGANTRFHNFSERSNLSVHGLFYLAGRTIINPLRSAADHLILISYSFILSESVRRNIHCTVSEKNHL